MLDDGYKEEPYFPLDLLDTGLGEEGMFGQCSITRKEMVLLSSIQESRSH